MPYETIPQLPSAVALDGTEQAWVVQNGADVRTTTATIARLGGGVGPAGPPGPTGPAGPQGPVGAPTPNDFAAICGNIANATAVLATWITMLQTGGYWFFAPGTYNGVFSALTQGCSNPGLTMIGVPGQSIITCKNGLTYVDARFANIWCQGMTFQAAATLGSGSVFGFDNQTTDFDLFHIENNTFINVLAFRTSSAIPAPTQARVRRVEVIGNTSRHRDGLSRWMAHANDSALYQGNNIDCGKAGGIQGSFGGIIHGYIPNPGNGFWPTQIRDVEFIGNVIRNVKPTSDPGSSGNYGCQSQAGRVTSIGNTYENIYPNFGTAQSFTLGTGNGSTRTFTGTLTKSFTTNATTAAGNPTVHIASVPGWVCPNLAITDTTAAVIPASTTILSTTGSTIVLSANATGGGVGNGDTIVVAAPPTPTSMVITAGAITGDDDWAWGALPLGYGILEGTGIVQWGPVLALDVTTAGTGYTNGTYTSVPIQSTSAAGTGCVATVVVSGGKISSLTPTTAGTLYALYDPITLNAADVGGTGSGFTGTVSQVTLSSWINYNTGTYSICFSTAPANAVAVTAAYFIGTPIDNVETEYFKSDWSTRIGNRYHNCQNRQGAIALKGGGLNGTSATPSYVGGANRQYGNNIVGNFVINEVQMGIFSDSRGIWCQSDVVNAVGNHFEGLTARVFRANLQGQARQISIAETTVRNHYGPDMFFLTGPMQNVSIRGVDVDGLLSAAQQIIVSASAATDTINNLTVRDLTISDSCTFGTFVAVQASANTGGLVDVKLTGLRNLATCAIAVQKKGTASAGRIVVDDYCTATVTAAIDSTGATPCTNTTLGFSYA